MGWDGIDCWYHVGTGVATALKLAQRPTAFLPRHSANLVGRVIPKSKLPHSHVCTDEFTQTGATYYITIFRFPEGSCSSPQRKEVARVHSRGKLLDSTEGGNCSNLQRRKQMESTKEETAQVLESSVPNHLENQTQSCADDRTWVKKRMNP